MSDAKQRAVLSAQVLDNPMFNSAIEHTRERLFKQFVNTKAEESEVREEVWRSMQNLESICKELKKAINEGKMKR
jgi:hypothetical protein